MHWAQDSNPGLSDSEVRALRSPAALPRLSLKVLLEHHVGQWPERLGRLSFLPSAQTLDTVKLLPLENNRFGKM